MNSYQLARKYFSFSYLDFKKEISEELKKERDKLNFSFSDLISSKRNSERKRKYLQLTSLIEKLNK